MNWDRVLTHPNKDEIMNIHMSPMHWDRVLTHPNINKEFNQLKAMLV